MIGTGRCISPGAKCSAILRPLSRERSGNRRLIGPSQSSANCLNERTISLQSKLARFSFEGRVVCDESELMLHECAERFGNKVELAVELLIGLAQSVEAEAESFVELCRSATFQPCAESIGEDRSLR